MKTKHTDVVSASEIASWAWCPESWRLEALGREPGNMAELARGHTFHKHTADVEVTSRRVVRLARWLFVIALLLAALWVPLILGDGPMNAVLLSAVTVGALALLLLLVSLLSRARRGLGRGETVALDDVTLHSARLKLVGRPDRIVKSGGMYIPEEWKSSRRVNHGHELQLGTYFLLIEEECGVRPPYGVVVLGDGSRVRVRNTEALRSEVLSIATRIRETRARLSLPVRVNQPVNKCRRCGQRANCEVANG